MLKHEKLSKVMTPEQFANGYWYADELKNFAEEIGIPSAAKLRKDELEKAIIHFLKTKKVSQPTRRSLTTSGIKDIEKGLRLDLPIVNYTSNRLTKDFIVREALKIAPGLKKKSGARYRLNRWREERLSQGRKITYGDLVQQYVKLNQSEESFAKIPSGRYINFLSEFLKNEKGKSREEAIKAWHELKKLNILKNYHEWKKYKSEKK